MPDGDPAHESPGWTGSEFGVIRAGHAVPDVMGLAEGDLIRLRRSGSHPATLRVTSTGTPDADGDVIFTTELVSASVIPDRPRPEWVSDA